MTSAKVLPIKQSFLEDLPMPQEPEKYKDLIAAFTPQAYKAGINLQEFEAYIHLCIIMLQNDKSICKQLMQSTFELYSDYHGQK